MKKQKIKTKLTKKNYLNNLKKKKKMKKKNNKKKIKK